MRYSHLFGPVLSRRLGRSLGVDLVPYKVCSFDCVYCECGDTTKVVLSRENFFPVEEVRDELDDYISRSPVLDYITFSGSGEPTLSLSIGICIRYLKERFPSYRVAVLTNGTLLWKEDVRSDLIDADIVLPTLSSAIEETYRRIHRPAPGLPIELIINGIEQFRKEFGGEIWLEIFIIPGINTTKPELEALRKAIRRIHPDRVQLNTLDRPGTESWVRPASPGELRKVRHMLGLACIEAVEPVTHGTFRGTEFSEWTDAVTRVHDLLQRRPSTLEDIIDVTGLNRREVLKILRVIGARSPVTEKKEERGIFYSCPP
ncbi:MAG: radical SAM protein [Methanoregulaceae archaeon]|nr:radical SAM protein [Methanoregulaceae archaeon]